MFTALAFSKNLKGETLAAISQSYESARDAHFRKGGRPAHKTIVSQDGVEFGYISNNGRIWSLKEWEQNDVPIYDNRAA